jgi:solute carrier family 13 (sodium-dependent dicarboxylate transporter), member 2/3/5
MRTLYEAMGAVEAYSPAEERFNRRRRTAGLFLAPFTFLLVLALPLDLPGPAHRLAAVLAAVGVLWLTEALPMAIAALLGPAAAVLMGVAPASEAFATFADPLVFLLIGSFILAEAMLVHGVDRKIASVALSGWTVSGGQFRVLVAYGAAAGFLSMWASNPTAAAMMLPVGIALLTRLRLALRPNHPLAERFALTMMLVTSFAVSLGGLATPVGTPPNVIGIGMLRRLAGVHISFPAWTVLGSLVALLLLRFSSCSSGTA